VDRVSDLKFDITESGRPGPNEKVEWVGDGILGPLPTENVDRVGDGILGMLCEDGIPVWPGIPRLR